jgi:dihydrofolate reductase
MRKLILQMQLTVDGFAADANGGNDWQVWNWGAAWNWDDELKKYFTNIAETVDCILLSRKMAKEGFIDHWKQAAESLSDPRYAFAKKVNEVRKVVFSKTLQQSDPMFTGSDNIDLASGDLRAEINRLKSREGKNIIVYGGATFVSALIKAELIDEFQLYINPAAIGSGMSIFNSLDHTQALTLVKAKSYACGIAVLHYRLKK